MDTAKIEKLIKEILIAIGENPEREGLKKTPKRIANLYKEIFAGIGKDPSKIIKVFKAKDYDEIIILKDIPLYSICEHHLLPFIGKAHIAYIPKGGRVTGLSKIARVVDIFSKRLQVQETLTTQIADLLMKKLKPWGVITIIEAEHLCMTMRGIKKPGSITITSAIRGGFRTHPESRMEALSLLRSKKD